MTYEPNFNLARSNESEFALVGTCLCTPDAFESAIGLIGEPDLFRQQGRIVWQVMADLHEQGKRWDACVIADELATRGLLESVGGRVHLTDLLLQATSRHLVPDYCRTIREASARRQLQGLGADLLSGAEHESPVDFATSHAAKVEAVAAACSDANDESFSRIVRVTTRDLIERSESGIPPACQTGYPILDGLLIGLHPADLIYLAARPSIGKTALGLNIAENILRRGEPVAFVSLEMSQQQIVYRLMSSLSGIDLPTIRAAKVSPIEALVEVSKQVGALPLTLTDKAAMSVAEIRAFARGAIATNGPCPLIIDYLGLIRDTERSENRNLAVAEISRGLKAIAKDLGIPVLALSQLNRQPEQRTGKRPTMSDLRDSGALEQDADVILLLHREDRGAREATLDIAKQRNGPTGSVEFEFDGPRTRFDEVRPPDPFKERGL